MYIVFFLLWIVFNGNITLEIILFGLGIAGLMYGFICKFMNYSVKKDIRFLKRFFLLLQYVRILIVEIIKSNFTAMRLLFSSRNEIEPAIIRFRTSLKSKTARVLLANSITLTPGTITVSLDEDEYVVHCLDKSMAEGISDSVFVKALEKIEEVE